MALKLTCPHCSRVHRLSAPYPVPGTELQCWCGRVLSISYPPGLVSKLATRGEAFRSESERSIAAGDLAATAGAAEGAEAPSPAPDDFEDEPTTVFRREPAPPTSEETDPRLTELGGPAAAAIGLDEFPARDAPPLKRRSAPPPKQRSAPPPKRRKSRWRWLGYLAGLGVLGAAAGAAVVVGAIDHYSQDLPALEILADYRPPTVTVVNDSAGAPLGEIYEKRRYVVDYSAFPEHLKDAFIAAEDANFWSHKGVDPEGILRAVLRNAIEGKKAQGASTITQQVARNFLLTPEKSYARKIREMILATRVEGAFDKEYILYLYLNQIYLGSGAYGVEAAARIYFDKHVQELTVAEAALLAGLPQRPSDYSPHRHWDKARARQEYVIGQMVQKGFLTAAEGDAALAERIAVYKKPNLIRLRAPYFTEQVRRHLVDTYGFDRVYNEGLVATTTCDLALQQVAQDSVTRQVTELDWKLGWRGPDDHLETDAAISETLERVSEELRAADQLATDAALRAPMPERATLVEGERYTAVALEVEKKHAVLGVGRSKVIVPLSWTTWASEPNENIGWSYRARQTDMSKVLKRGDIVTVRVEAADAETAGPFKDYAPASGKGYAAARLYQKPELQGAMMAFELKTGAVTAMVGGVDIAESEFNRAVQAQRQVGSTFKPVVYSTAIKSRKFTVASQILDGPIIYNTLGKKLWKPGNFGNDYMGNISLRKALALSRNVCTVRVLDIIGMDGVYKMARTLGIESHLEVDLSMGLGSNSLTMWELGRAYSVFATYGNKVEPYVIERVEDRDGRVLEQHRDRPWETVLDPSVAGITTWLLHEVATVGTGAGSNVLGFPVAGKTGTTNDFKDGWFVGFNPDHLALAWVGYDQPRTMTGSSTGGQVALPIWLDYMRAAVPDPKRAPPFADIPNVDWAPIDESTGRVAKGGRRLPFLKGTVPEGSLDVSVGQATAEDLMSTDF